MAKKSNPDEKRIKEIIDRANSSKANFVSRLKQENRRYIPDWEINGSIATHKMRAEIDNNGRAIVFPDVQEIGGVLYDFTDPKNGHKPWDSMDNAIQNNDTVIFDSLDDAIWFSENYKDYYPKFDKYKEGGKVSKWKPSKSILDYVKSVERFNPVIYKDGNGVETIGYGFTDKDLINKYRGKRMSKKEAERIFMEEKVPEFTGYVINYTENFDKLTDNQRDALFSYVYNIGSGNYRKNNPNLHKALQNEDWMTAAQYIDFGYKDEKNKGLRIRRNYERELFGYASDEEGNVYPIKTEEEKEVQEESVDQPAEEEGEKNVLLNSILGIKNDLEMQHPVSTTRDEAFREARKKGLKVFTWDGKKYNTKMKKDGGPVDEDGEDGGAKYRYIASMDNTSVGSGGINENANYNTAPISGVDISEVVAGGVPIVGDVVDVKDMYDSSVDRDALGMVMAAAGLIPVVGGIPKKAMQVKRTVKNMTRRDEELLKSLPEYAKPASPIGESWENHKKRLFSGAYEKLTGERLKMKNGGPDPTMLDVNIYNWDDPKVFNDAKYFLGDEYSDDEIREIIDGIYGYGILNGNIIRSKNADKLIDSFIESNPGISNDDIENFIKSHEVEHSIHYPDSNADKNGFDLNRVNDREVRDYFKEDHFTEMAARGTQIKNYFGLTDDSQEVTPEMLEYAAMNYLKDYGYDNNMKEYFESISDYKKAAKWITDHASVGIGSYYIGDKVSNPKKEKKRDGGSLTPYKAGFRFLDHKKEYGDPKGISRRIPSKKFMYFYIDEKPEMEEGGFVPDWMLQRNKLINRRGMSRCKNGGEANRWWEDPEGRDRVVKRQKEAANRQEKRRRLIDQAYSDLENGEIDEDEFRRIVGFSNSGIGDLIISKDGNGEEIGTIINSLLNNIDVDKVKKGIDDAKKGMEDKNKEDAYPYKLMAESLLTLADVASSTPGMLRLYDKMGLRLMPVLKTIAESSKIQSIAGLSNMGIDGSKIALDPEGDNAFNYAGILGGAAEAIGGTNIARNTSLMGRYGDRIDDVLDVANPIISLLGIADDVSKKKEGGVISNSDFIKDTSMARDALRVDSSHNLSYSYIPQNDTSHHSFDIESLIKESSGIKPYDDMPDIKKHKVHKGDTLWSISKKTGVHIDDIILYNPQIKDINKIEVGDEVNLEAPIYSPKTLDYKEIKEKESVLNKSGDNVAIIKSVQHNSNFAIIDKKKKAIEVYSPDNELLYTGMIGTGRSGDDYNTITYAKKDGSIMDGKGNNSTPAGITMVTGKSTYHGVPAFIRSRYNKKTGEWDDNIASSMHWGAHDGSNGCVRLIGDTANELDKYIKQGTMVYTLPEKDGSRFMIRDGMLSYIADNPYGKDEKGDPKRYWDDYNTFNDKTYKPIDISQIDSDININVNHASMSPKAIARDLLLRFVDTGDRNENVNAFISGIEDYKKAIMADTGIDSATYNDLADIALGIAEQESKFGTSVKYALKNALTQEQLDLMKTIKGGVKGIAKDLNNIDEITLDGVLEHFKKPISYRSNGITQIKTKGDNYRTRVLYDKYGIDEESLKNPYMSGAGTMLRLASIYRDEVAGRKFKGSEGDIDPMDAVLYKWSGRNRLLRSGKANPKLDEYHNNVKRYASNFRINTVDKFDERLGGDEATVQDKPAMNIDDVTPSLVWEKNTGLSDVNGRRQSIPLYAEGGAVKKQREAYKYLTEKRGMSKIQALAVIGNLMAESMLKEDVYGDNGTSYGIQQWHNERMDMLFKQARKKGHSEPTFQDQLEFLADEYEGKTGYSNFLYTRKGKDGPGYYNYSKQDFQNAETLQDAVIAWNQGAGRPHKSVTRNTTRYELAKKAAENLGLKIEEDIKPRYGQMGFDTDFTVKEDREEPWVEASYMTGQDEDMAGQQVPIGAEASGIAKEDMFKLWTETYGKDIVANLMSLKTDDSDSRAIDEEYEERYKQYVKESEEDKKRALIEAILPGLQLKIKGMTD